MTSPLDAALAAVGERAGPGDTVGRVDVDRHGLVVWTESPAGPRWFRWADGELAELDPTTDPDVPLARTVGRRDRVLAWRPRRRVLVEHAADGGALLRKGYRSERALARSAARHAAAARAARFSGFVVPEVRGTDEAQAALRLERLDAAPLRIGEREAVRIGAALRELQEDGPRSGLDEHDARAEVDVVRAAWAKVDAVEPGESGRGSELTARLDDAAGRLPEASFTLTHRDLHDRQLGELDGRIALFDFDLVCSADPALDAANLAAHFVLRGLQGEPAFRSADPTAALLTGLDRGSEPSFAARFAFYRAATFVRLAAVYRLRPRWAPLCPRLLDRAQDGVEELDRAL